MLRTWYGIQEPVDEAKRFIFDNGLNSEHQLVELLTKAVSAQGAETMQRVLPCQPANVTEKPSFSAKNPENGCSLWG